MIIELSRIYNNKPYYIIRYKDNTTAHAFGYEQIKSFVKKAKDSGEEIEITETKFLEEHDKLTDLLKS